MNRAALPMAGRGPTTELPTLLAGGGSDWLIAAGWAFAFALLGGVVANSWLRPAGRRSPR